MPKFGSYPIADALEPGDEISSSDEGRVLTLLESDLIHPDHTDGLVNQRDPVVFGTTGLRGVGVARIAALAATDLISIDTEGLYNFDVVAANDDGGVDVAGGDQLYINITTAVISKISNSVTQVPFGYALGIITSGNTEAIAVKVHFDQPVTGGIGALKGVDHVQGTVADPIAWGTDTSNVKSVVMSVGIMTDYLSGLFMHAFAEAATPAGGIQGLIYSRITAQDDVQDMYAVRGRTDLIMSTPGAHIANMVVGGMFAANLDNPGFALTLADRIKAIDCSIGQTATSTITTGSICGMYVGMNGVEVDNSGRTSGIYIYQGGGGTSYPDYGIYIQMESEHTLAGLKIEQLAVAAGWGIQLHDSGGFGFDALFAYTGVNAQGYFLWLETASGVEDSAIPFDTATCGETADRRLRVRCEGDTTDRYIYLFPV